MNNIFVIIGSASRNSSNEKLVAWLTEHTREIFRFIVYNDLSILPHFNPERSVADVPIAVQDFRRILEQADGVLISTPEYIFSIPGGLKNAFEWCVATTVFTGKPVGLITASASGMKGHEEVQLILKTLSAHFTPETTLLIQGIKGKLDELGNITDPALETALRQFIASFNAQVNQPQAHESSIIKG